VTASQISLGARVVQNLPAPASDGFGTLIGLGWAIVLSLAAGFTAWAYLAPLNAATIAQGTVVVSSNRKTIQHLEGGIVKAIVAHDGDAVRAGDPLVILEEAQTLARLNLLEGRDDVSRAEQARLMAERTGIDTIEFDPDLTKKATASIATAQVLEGQRRLFTARREMLEGQIVILRNRIAQSDIQVAGLRAQEAAKQRQLGMFRQETAGLVTLNEKGIVSSNRVLSIQRDAAQISADLGMITSSIAGVQQAVNEARLQILQVTKTFNESVETNARETRSTVFDLAQQLVAARDQVARLTIRAPSSGRVVDSAVHTVGGVLPPGQRLMDIVPMDDKLIVEARIAPNDIDGVVVGAQAEVRFPAFHRTIAAPIFGRVVSVSADRLIDPRSTAPYYLVRVEPTMAAGAEFDQIRLAPGLSAEVVIDKGARSFAEYLLGPIGNVLKAALRQ